MRSKLWITLTLCAINTAASAQPQNPYQNPVLKTDSGTAVPRSMAQYTTPEDKSNTEEPGTKPEMNKESAPIKDDQGRGLGFRSRLRADDGR